MKKLLLVFLSFIFSFLLVGCVRFDIEINTPTTTPTIKEEVTSPTITDSEETNDVEEHEPIRRSTALLQSCAKKLPQIIPVSPLRLRMLLTRFLRAHTAVKMTGISHWFTPAAIHIRWPDIQFRSCALFLTVI